MRLSFATAALIIATVPFAAAAEDLQPGQYQSTITSDIPGDKTQNDTHCVTQKDIDSGLKHFGAGKDDPSCKTLDFKRGPGSVSYRTVCSQGGVSNSSEVNGTFTRDTFDMRITMQLDPKSKPNTIRFVGKRIGECKGKQK